MRIQSPARLWSPLNNLFQLQDELFRAFHGTRELVPTEGVPALGVWSSDEGIRLTAEVPGLSADDLELSLEGKRLTLAGTFPDRAPEGEFRTVRRERRTGSFRRAVELPFRVREDAVEARLENGCLELFLPRAEEEKSRTIPIRVNKSEG